MAMTSEGIDMILLDMEAEGLLIVSDDGSFKPTEKGLMVLEAELVKRAAKIGVQLTVMTN